LSTNWHESEPRPALAVHPLDADNLDEAHSAIELWEHYSGKALDSAQRLAVELVMAETSDGRWAAQTTGRAVSRQNGKGDEIEVVEAWGAVARGEWIIHTTHEEPVAKRAFERMVGFLSSHPDLERKVEKTIAGNGPKIIYMTRAAGGGRITYRTRTGAGARGLDDVSRLVVDEAQHVQSEMLASSSPTTAVNPNPQTNYIGSAGVEGKSDWWWNLRVRALRNAGGAFSWLEHSAERVELSPDGRVLQIRPEDVTDRAVWALANPALGVRISERYLAEQLENMGPELFAREHLCVWDPYPNADGGFLPFDQWKDLVIEAPESQRTVCYGLSATEGSATFSSASRLPNGDLYVDMVECRPGTDWVLDAAVERFIRKRIPLRVNPSAPEGAFVRPLRELGVEIVEVTPRDYQQACGEVLDAVKNGKIHHLGQAELDRAVRSAERRDVGKEGGWVWADPASGVDLSPLKAATLALSGVTGRRPPRIYSLAEKE
jgi:hypothetical protein